MFLKLLNKMSICKLSLSSSNNLFDDLKHLSSTKKGEVEDGGSYFSSALYIY